MSMIATHSCFKGWIPNKYGGGMLLPICTWLCFRVDLKCIGYLIGEERRKSKWCLMLFQFSPLILFFFCAKIFNWPYCGTSNFMLTYAVISLANLLTQNLESRSILWKVLRISQWIVLLSSHQNNILSMLGPPFLPFVLRPLRLSLYGSPSFGWWLLFWGSFLAAS